MKSFPLEARTNFKMMNITLLLTMSIVSVSLSRKLFKEEFMKEKIESIRKIFEELRDQIDSFELSDLREKEWIIKIDKLEELAEELEFLCEEVA
jgi:hypothetical protein